MTDRPRTPVVGAAILRDGAVLAARRTTPSEAAGRWEFPGGKVEPGESADEALVREISEELGCRVELTGWLPGTALIGDAYELRVACGVLVDGEPAPTEHDLIRWVGLGELDTLDWLDPDRPLPAAPAREDGPVRAIFFEDGEARQVVRRLVAAGFEAAVERERLAGEDDDEGHPWAVVTDAPEFMVELLVDEFDGWLDSGTPQPSAPPLDLPAAPKRIKKPLV